MRSDFLWNIQTVLWGYIEQSHSECMVWTVPMCWIQSLLIPYLIKILICTLWHGYIVVVFSPRKNVSLYIASTRSVTWTCTEQTATSTATRSTSKTHTWSILLFIKHYYMAQFTFIKGIIRGFKLSDKALVSFRFTSVEVACIKVIVHPEINNTYCSSYLSCCNLRKYRLLILQLS